MYPKDAKTVLITNTATDVYDLGTVGDITVLNISTRVIAPPDSAPFNLQVSCASGGVYNNLYSLPEPNTGTNLGQSTFDEFNGQHVCNGGIIEVSNPNAESVSVAVTYLEYDIHDPQYGFIGSVQYGDFIIPMAMIVFLLAFLAWGVLFSPFKPRRRYATI